MGRERGDIDASAKVLVVRWPARSRAHAHAPRRAVPDSHASRAQPGRAASRRCVRDFSLFALFLGGLFFLMPPVKPLPPSARCIGTFSLPAMASSSSLSSASHAVIGAPCSTPSQPLAPPSPTCARPASLLLPPAAPRRRRHASLCCSLSCAKHLRCCTYGCSLQVSLQAPVSRAHTHA